MMRFLPILAFGLVCLVGGIALYNKEHPATIPQHAETPLPDITIPLLDGSSNLTNADLPNGTFLIHVLASWCAVCVVEHEYLKYLHSKYTIPTIAIGWHDKPADFSRWLKQHGDFYDKVTLDESGAAGIEFGITGTPETFLVKNRTILHHHKGPVTPDVWDTYFAEHFDE